MNERNNIQAEFNSGKLPQSTSERAMFRRVALGSLAVILCFAKPLYDLVQFALHSDLYSHIVLIPFVSLYLIWIKRPILPGPSDVSRKLALSFLGTGAIILGAYWVTISQGIRLAQEDALAAKILSFLFFLIGVSAWFLGRCTVRALAFPLAFLLFMIPFPVMVRNGMETFLQHGSAAAAYALFKVSGTTFFYQDLIFRLPGINLEVAPECSGIRSSLALFLTSLLAGHFFLRTPWKCAVLTLSVIPLAILRNGLRIFTIGELCVHVGPDMINSYIHHHGGPIFFVISLIPFFFLLRFLLKSERPRPTPTQPPAV